MDHPHCSKCVFLNCTAFDGCPMTACPEIGCKSCLHACKLDDHRSHICQYVNVPCINALYGCSARLPRGQMSLHLVKCPASVVVCPHWEDKQRTDLSWALDYRSMFRRDEFASHMEDVHVFLEPSLTFSSVNGRHHCPHWQYGCDFSVEQLLPLNKHWEVAYNRKEELFVLRLTVEDQREKLEQSLDGSGSQSPISDVASEETASAEDGVRPGLHRSFSREEELEFYGYGSGDNVLLHGNATLSGPGAVTKEQELAFYGYGEVDESDSITLDNLPVEILLMILTCLDAQSLRAVSLVSMHFRKVCHTITAERGLVFQPWRQVKSYDDNEVHWLEEQYLVRMFSTATTPIGSTNWQWSDTAFLMADHLMLKHCHLDDCQPEPELLERAATFVKDRERPSGVSSSSVPLPGLAF